MKYFLDTEFIEKPNTIQLISIGIVAEDGREYYAISSEYNYNDADDWVKENVINPMYKEQLKVIENNWDSFNHFNLGDVSDFHQKWAGKTLDTIKQEILNFIGKDSPEFWGYYADYDWVVFCWIFGKMIDLPRGWPMYCKDLKQFSDSINAPKFKEPNGEHNALCDAKWNKEMYEYLKSI
jgi:hypothetical protein